VAGALDGLYRSVNYGESWERITPAGHADLKNFESVAVDEHNRDVIYAGTWHLPWKTTDGGAHWFNIKQGVIDDSDVFSIILDHSNQSTVFLSACSGIYKSENAGALFHKVQGIPGTARRTRVLEQDPVDALAVYAGTTEGLWKTTDGGRNFHLISPPNYILNDVLVEARNPRRVLIATDRGGVYSSDDAGASFHPSNHGFSKRQVSALVADPREAGTLYAAVLNDKEFGGVFRYRAGEWTQFGKGLEGLEVFDLAEAPNGMLMAATNRGVYLYESASWVWAARTDVVNERPAPQTRVVRKVYGKLVQPTPRPPIVVHSNFKGRASAIVFGERWYAATENGLLRSEDQGKTWQGGPFGGEKELLAVAARGAVVVTVGLHELWQSQDGGRNFVRLTLPAWVTRLYGVAIATDGALWVASREGALRYDAATSRWDHVLAGLPAREVTSIRVQGDLLLATAEGMESVAVSRDQGRSWQVQPATGYEVGGAVLEGGRLYLATRHHGVLAGGTLPGETLAGRAPSGAALSH
jgi:ligand-binding sensor domain-containing protein